MFIVICGHSLRIAAVFAREISRPSQASLLFTMSRLCICRRISVRAIKEQWRSANRVCSGPDAEIEKRARAVARATPSGVLAEQFRICR
jgi:hypothetical protein